jgi:hypothetical protein
MGHPAGEGEGRRRWGKGDLELAQAEALDKFGYIVVVPHQLQHLPAQRIISHLFPDAPQTDIFEPLRHKNFRPHLQGLLALEGNAVRITVRVVHVRVIITAVFVAGGRRA